MNQRPVWCNSSTINIKQLMRSWKSCQGLPVSTDWAIHERHFDDAGWARDEECDVDVDRDGERFILPVMPAYFSKSMNTLQRGTQNSSWNLVIVDEKTKLKVFEILSGETLYLRSKSVRACGMNPRRRRSNEMSVELVSNFQQSRDRMSREADEIEELEMWGEITSTKAWEMSEMNSLIEMGFSWHLIKWDQVSGA